MRELGEVYMVCIPALCSFGEAGRVYIFFLDKLTHTYEYST